MLLSEVYQSDQLAISFELFPPKTAKGEVNLYKNVAELMAFQPAYITCTYGAGGSTQAKTLEIVSRIKQDFQVPVASHLTLVGSSADDLRTYLNSAHDQDIDYIVALRGDPPAGESEFRQTEGGFRYANELVSLIHTEYNQFGVIVAGYPEKHIEASSMDVDLDNLKRKVDAGADIIITQLFYDNEDFYRFRELCDQKGITVPVIPGILPVTSLQQIQRITSLCGASLPAGFVEQLGEKDSPEWQFQVGVEKAIEQVTDLTVNGVSGIHFYVLNRSGATSQILAGVNNCQ